MEVEQELADEDEPRKPLWKRAVSVDVRLGDAGIGAEPLHAPFAHGGERGKQVRLGRVLREEHLDELLELEDGTSTGGRHPFRKGTPALGGDRVDGSDPLPYYLHRRPCA